MIGSFHSWSPARRVIDHSPVVRMRTIPPPPSYIPSFATATTRYAILAEPFLHPFLCGYLLVGTTTSKKSNRFNGSRSPHSRWFEPNSSASMHPSPSEYCPLDGVEVGAAV